MHCLSYLVFCFIRLCINSHCYFFTFKSIFQVLCMSLNRQQNVQKHSQVNLISKPCPIRTRPAIITIPIVDTLQMTKIIFKRLAADTLIEFILIKSTRRKPNMFFVYIVKSYKRTNHENCRHFHELWRRSTI